MDMDFYGKIQYIIEEIRSAGYDPYAQLTGFVRTRDDRYITRRGNARSLILELDFAQVQQYLTCMVP